ncbi:MAG: hypothetical protein ACYDAY_02530 [Candidatus Dormibacteria bacterium]
MKSSRLVFALPALVAASQSLGALATPAVPVTLAPVRSLEPVVITGAQVPDWSAGPELTFRADQPPGGTLQGVPFGDTQGKLPAQLRSDCYDPSNQPDVNGWVDPNHGDHNCYQSSQLPFRTTPGRTGVDPNLIRGYRWDGQGFVQIPFQVDTRWVHYLSNNASGFAAYSGVDQETTYTFDREGFRYTTNLPFDPADPGVVCRALPKNGVKAAPDPNQSLIDTDEMAFMYRDTGDAAPAGTPLPSGISAAKQVLVTDPVSGARQYVYLMLSERDGGGNAVVAPGYTAANSPYVHYQRDANADTFVYSQSSYSDYGNAPYGPVCDNHGNPVVGEGFRVDPSTGGLVLDPSTYVQRRPLDGATVTTPRYSFRYDGRWLMTAIQVSPDDQGLTAGDYGPNIVDRWKARAFQQSPGGKTPCCGYEEEATNWGGSSQLLGEKVGPVRVIRATWGADSSTNNIRTEIFYPYEVRYQDNLRVHVIPPADGIYVQRDMAAGEITTYYNPYQPQGVAIDGLNDEVFGNTHAYVGSSGVSVDGNDSLSNTVRALNGGHPVHVCNPTDPTCGEDGPTNNDCSNCIHGDFDTVDPTFSGPPALFEWEELTGPHGTLVERWGARQVTGGSAYTLTTAPYYRDDSCFDDGTGNDPGPKLHLRSAAEPTVWWYDPTSGVPTSVTYNADGSANNPPAGVTTFARRCWNHHADGTPYNLAGSTFFDPTKPVEAPDPKPDPNFSPLGDVRYFQGDIGTHGLHLELIADSDNADQTVPVDEIDSEQRQIILPGQQPNIGDAYGHAFDEPLVATVTPAL